MSLHIQESLLPTSRLVRVLISYSRFCKCTTSQGQGRICMFCSSVYLQQWAQALAQDQSTFITVASLNSLANHASSLRSGTVPQGVACYREKNMGLVHVSSKSSYTTVSGCVISQVSTSPTVSGNNDTVKTKRDIENNVLANLAANVLSIFLPRRIFVTQWVNDKSNEAAQQRSPFPHSSSQAMPSFPSSWPAWLSACGNVQKMLQWATGKAFARGRGKKDRLNTHVLSIY